MPAISPSTVSTLPSRFFNPLALWADVAANTSDMLLRSSTVVQIRSGQLLRSSTLGASAADMKEFSLMGNEKLAAATESSSAMANQFHATQFALTHRAVRQSLQAAEALGALLFSVSPSLAATQAQRLLRATQRSMATASQLSSAPARIAQRGLRPIHQRAASNARRLTAPPPASAA